MQYVGNTEHEATYTAPAAADGTIALPEAAQANDLIFLRLSAVGSQINGQNDECVVTDDLASVLLPIYNRDGASDVDTSGNSTLGAYTRYKVATGGETEVSYEIDEGGQTTRVFGHLTLFRPAADEAWQVDSVNPHGLGTLPSGAEGSNDHTVGETGTSARTLALGAHDGAGADEDNYLGFGDYTKGLRLAYTVGVGMLAGGLTSKPAAYTQISATTFFPAVYVIQHFFGYEVDATSEPAENFVWSGYSGSRETKVWRWVFPYRTLPPATTGPSYQIQTRRVQARELPYMVTPKMVDDARNG